MRFEGDEGERARKLSRDAPRLPDHRLMAAMHAVEIADDNDRAPRLGRHGIVVAEDAHWLAVHKGRDTGRQGNRQAVSCRRRGAQKARKRRALSPGPAP